MPPSEEPPFYWVLKQHPWTLKVNLCNYAALETIPQKGSFLLRQVLEGRTRAQKKTIRRETSLGEMDQWLERLMQMLDGMSVAVETGEAKGYGPGHVKLYELDWEYVKDWVTVMTK